MHSNNENDLTLSGDGSSTADTTANPNNPNDNKSENSGPQGKPDGSPTSQPKKPISEARLRANQQNAKKSTGPKTARGKRNSSRNSMTHGLLLKRLLFSPEGEPINEELHQLWEDLHERYGEGDVRSRLLVEGLVVEYWRQHLALLGELRIFQTAVWPFAPQGHMPNLQRYATASQHAFHKNLQLLDEMQPPTSEEEDETQDDAFVPQPENPQPPMSTNGLSVVGPEESPLEEEPA